ncbi:MAG: hypothetical protein U0174_18415 [Polyangiaceae bacterium]
MRQDGSKFYLLWYLLPFISSWALHRPALVTVLIVLWFFRDKLPDPWARFRAWRRSVTLRREIEANPANLSAAEGLMEAYLASGRRAEAERTALSLIDRMRNEVPRRGTPEGEAHAFYVVALARADSNPEGALEAIIQCVDVSPGFRQGEPYALAGRALESLGRYEQAEEAYERWTECNRSSLAGHRGLSRVRAKLGRAQDARKAVQEGLSVYRTLPRFRRVQERRDWLALLWTRVFA